MLLNGIWCTPVESKNAREVRIHEVGSRLGRERAYGIPGELARGPLVGVCVRLSALLPTSCVTLGESLELFVS